MPGIYKILQNGVKPEGKKLVDLRIWELDINISLEKDFQSSNKPKITSYEFSQQQPESRCAN